MSTKKEGNQRLNELRKTELDILSAFFPFVDEIKSTKEIEQEVCYSHERVHTVLKNLVRRGFVSKKSLGNVNIFKLNKRRSELFFIYVYFLEKRKGRVRLNDELLQSMRNLLHVHGTGEFSAAVFEKPIECAGKNIKFLCLFNSLEKAEKHRLNLTENSDLSNEMMVLSIKEFEQIKHSDQEFYRRIIDNSVVLFGIENFYCQIFNRGGRLYE